MTQNFHITELDLEIIRLQTLVDALELRVAVLEKRPAPYVHPLYGPIMHPGSITFGSNNDH